MKTVLEHSESQSLLPGLPATYTYTDSDTDTVDTQIEILIAKVTDSIEF